MKTPIRSGFSGVYPMLYAFFDKTGRLHRSAMRQEVRAMLATRVHGLAILVASEGDHHE
jgi:4-hydroxy-tetrahydrodipicolinate synthase